MTKKTSQEWYEELRKIDQRVAIVDPDGWDRKNFNKSWYKEKIAPTEFVRRFFGSTVTHPVGFDVLTELVRKYE